MLRRFQEVASFLLLVAVALAATALVGWLTGVESLRSIIPGRTAMNPLTAVTFLVGAAAMWPELRNPSGRRIWSTTAAGAFLAVVGSVTTIGYMLGHNLGLDQILFNEQLGANRIAPNTGVVFLLVGIGLLAVNAGRSGNVRIAEVMGLFALLSAVNAILGYLYGASALYGWAQFIPMALPTALCFLALSLALLFARPQYGLMTLVSNPTMGGRLARRLLPLLVIGPAFVGYLRLLGEQAGLYDAGFGVSLFAAVVIFFLVTLMLLTSRSLTRAELVQKATDAAHARLAAIVESADDAIVGKNLDGTITSWNRGAERLYGYSAQEIVGKSVRLLLPPDRLHEEDELLARVATGQTVTHIQTRRVRKNGGLVEVSLNLSPIRGPDGRVVSASAIARDITAEKKAEGELKAAREAAEAATRAKSAFLANMSHEIRTPLNAVIGMSGLLEDTKLTDEQREFAETIRLSGEHLLTIINDILDFSKIESGHLTLERHAFHLSDCIEDAMELVTNQARQKGLELAYSIEPGVPEWFLGDVGRVRQILVNLLSNAVKFTEEGGVSVTVGGRMLEQAQFELEVAVRDTGIGIPPEKQGHLFQSFSQADTSMSRRYGGTGLGLAISKQLIELMGGRVSMQSEVGKGTTFTFTLLLEAAPTPEEADPGPLRDLQGTRLLAVDDNAANRRLLTVLAERWGMVPRVTHDPAEALELLKGPDPFDIAILDYHMPGLDGVALGLKIRSLQHRAALPLILLSSTGGVVDSETMQKVRFARTLQKPARQSQLRDAVLAAINPSHVRVRRGGKPAAQATKTDALRVLLAEDNPTNQLVATKMLRKLGVTPEIVTNGLEAIRALERDRFDIVLMDVQMPVLDGLEATRQICARWPRGERPRIVAMTAEAMHGDRERCLEAGMDDYVTKPVKLSELERVLKAAASG